MKKVLPLYRFSNFASTPQPNLNEITRRLDSLYGQHADLTEKLRELHGDTGVQTAKQFKWHDFKNQVAKLRFEVENFKKLSN